MLSLLLEVDKYYFYKFYFLPNLNIIINDLEGDGSSEEHIIKSFFNKNNFGLSLNSSSFLKTPYFAFSYQMRNIYTPLNIDGKIHFALIKIEENKLSIFPIIISKDDHIPYHQIKADTAEQINCLRELGIIKEVLDFYHQLKKKIEEINQYIISEDESMI